MDQLAPELDYYSSLREANVARSHEWTGGEKVGAAFRGAELAGEVGEVLEWFYLDKPTPPRDMARLASYTPLDIVTPEQFRRFENHVVEELADVVICVDLTAMDLGLGALPIPPFAEGRLILTDGEGLKVFAAQMAAHAGLACNVLKKLEREARGWKGSRASKSDLKFHLFHVNRLAHCLGYVEAGPRFVGVVADKFNETSEKVGLLTRYVAPWSL